MTREELVRLFALTFAMVIILDCDEYLYSFFDSIHLPLPSTILTFIWLPFLILLVFYRQEKNKNKVMVSAVILGAVYLLYFIVHHLTDRNLVPVLDLPENYYYSTYHELSYFIRTIIPDRKSVV